MVQQENDLALRRLVSALRKGSREAFDAIYYRYVGRVYNFVLRMLDDAQKAEDLTQELFLRLWRCHESLSENKSFEAYIFTISRNLVLKEFRHRRTAISYVDYILETASEGEETTALDVDYNLMERSVLTTVESLPPARRMIYIKQKFENKSVKQIAAEMGLSPKTVENQLYQANKYMKEKLARTMGDFDTTRVITIDEN